MSKTLDPGATYQVQNRTDQVLDQYGNVTSMSLYDFGAPNGPPPGTPSRTYTNTYLNDSGYNHPAGSNYVAQHINNRLATSTVQGATGPATTLVSNNYDMTPPADSPGITQHDPAYNTGYIFRGNVTSSSGVGGTMSTGYDIAGNNPSTNVNGLITTAGFNTGTNYAAPSSITTNSLTTTLNWTAYLALGSETGPNGDSASMTYDGALRPATSTSSFGAVTTFSYSGNIKTATTNGHWVKTSVDGLGRTVKTETGDGASTKSVVDTVYAACGCTPLGKVSQVSQPHAPGATQYWTTYAYDATGRTTSVTAPDGSVTRYEYSANTVKVTDPAAKWKKFTMDAFGNLTSVLEPDPQLGNVTTSYSYDVLNHLSQVSMPRNGVTQTRTFNYGTPAGALLLSATNPENGTVTYTYNSDMTLATKTDEPAKQESLPASIEAAIL